MNLFAHSISSKGELAFVRRVGTISKRFNFTPGRVEGYLKAYLDTLDQFGTSATFPITAVVLKRHAAIIRRLAAVGVEFAAHGYIHTAHGSLSEVEQYRQLKLSRRVFGDEGIPVSGFRGPYLSYNDATMTVVEQLGFEYISNESFSYDVVNLESVHADRRDGFTRALRLYAAQPAARSVVRPRMRGRLVEIPVSLPDDEILVDRLSLNSGATVGAAWASMLDSAYERGDLLTLQLHPERGEICREALATVLRAARRKTPSVWIAQLRDIAAWWRRRLAFQLHVEPVGPDRWRISTEADASATVWTRKVSGALLVPWYGPYFIPSRPSAVVESATRPVVGLSPRSEQARQFLAEEGYAIHVTSEQADCSLFVDRPGPLTQEEQSNLLADINNSNVPLVGIGRWPNRARSAMAVTGDIDALTLIDFIMRIWEVR